MVKCNFPSLFPKKEQSYKSHDVHCAQEIFFISFNPIILYTTKYKLPVYFFHNLLYSPSCFNNINIMVITLWFVNGLNIFKFTDISNFTLN